VTGVIAVAGDANLAPTTLASLRPRQPPPTRPRIGE